MTREEVIAYLDDIMTDCVYGITSDEKESCEMAIEALQQPKIIRCGECKQSVIFRGKEYTDTRCFCTKGNSPIEVKFDDYCSYAERKEENA